MTSMQIHFESPAGTALLLGLKKVARSTLPTHGMYRVEIDTKYFFAKQPVSDLLMECFQRLGQSGRLFIGIHSSLETNLGESYAFIGENKKSTIYGMNLGEEISRDVINILTILPYGEIVFFEIAEGIDLSQHLPALTDWDGVMEALGDYVRWAVGYDNESATISFLSKDKKTLKKQVLAVLERNIDSI